MDNTLQVRVVDLLDGESRGAWDQCVLQSPQGTCFDRAAWLNAQRLYLKQKIRAVGIYDQDALVGGMTLLEVQHWGIRGARRPWATPFNHLFLMDTLSPQRTRECVSVLMNKILTRYHLVSVTTSYLDPSTGLYESSAHQTRTKATILLDISDSTTLWKRFQSELRNRIRKARKIGIVIREAESLEEFYTLYINLFAAKGRRVPYSKDQFCAFCQAIETSGEGRVFEARDAQGRLHVAALITWDTHAGYYTLSASHPELRKSGANSLLLWEICQRLSSRIRRFDLVGANLPTITRFKSRFRGETVTYREYSFYGDTWLRPGLQLLHRLTGR